MTIRALEREDFDAWVELWSGYLSFYRADLGDRVTRGTFERLCGETDGMFGLVALDPGAKLVGIANSVVHRSTWTLGSCCYLEDLFVARDRRGGEVGRDLIESTAAVARERGAERLYWQAQEFNGAARSLYDTVGQLTSMVVYERAL